MQLKSQKTFPVAQLRKSAYTNATDLDDVLRLAESGRGSAQQGYRAEFIRLVKTIGNDMAVSK
ncbi:MAG: YfbK domain-containing protein [Pricia sp.]